ncbi:hypothetical protein ANCCEY_09577 [Ancylostoma ceylanicum]|uniref:Uncharacterized protein n=1 Tax=Ancylostoma ceylanicum TaxID=53326 RepID=A0A0D6LGZ5_9BILA|nr:hypothetical protein ANCCEY_09577 [Ancylostoma ceylanicum]
MTPMLDNNRKAKVKLDLMSVNPDPIGNNNSTVSSLQDDRRTDIEGGADSRSAAVGAGVRPEWPAPEARDQHHGHVPHSHNRGHHLQVPHDERAYPDSEVDPNAILPEPRHRQRRPDWSAAAEARGREDEVAAGVTPAAHSRDEVRVRYVKPPVIVTDQYGRRYLTKVENGETIYYADPHTQDTTAERSEQSAGEERQQTDTEGWRAVEILQPQKQVRHPGQPYDPRRAKVEEQRRAQLEERRRAQEEAQRRAQEEEQRRAQEEERRRALHQAQLDRSRQMEINGGLIHIAHTPLLEHPTLRTVKSLHEV